MLADASMPGAVWFPGRELNYAERAVPRQAGRARRDRARVRAARAGEWTWGELRERTARIRAGLVARGRRSGRSGRGLPAERARDDRRVPGHRVARARCGRRRRPSSARAACATASGRSSRRCCWRSTATATAGRTSTGARRSTRSARRSARRSCGSATSTAAGWEDGFLGDGAAGVRAGAVRPPAVGPLLVGHDRAAEGDRAGPGRDPARAPEDDVPAPGRARGRPGVLVHHDGLDDVELPRLGAADRCGDRALRRQPGHPGPQPPVGPRRGVGDDDASARAPATSRRA